MYLSFQNGRQIIGGHFEKNLEIKKAAFMESWGIHDV
jgi:hypothetical protein